MRRPRIPYFFALIISPCLSLLLPVQVKAQQQAHPALDALRFDGQQQSPDTCGGLIAAQTRSSVAYAPGAAPVRLTTGGGGIKEDISDKYKARYQEWKNEFLSTEIGRKQWKTYEHNERFTLIITVSNQGRKGAGTSEYKWNEAGELIAATITLGSRIDEGFPDPIYYPVMSALAHTEPSVFNSNMLAAAKIAHEFGHVKQAAIMDAALYRLQNELIPVYNKILLSNGRNTRDSKLLDLTKQMGGTPVQIWEDREYWGEANAMLYLRDRITKSSEQRALFTRIIRTVELYAINYIERFDEIAK